MQRDACARADVSIYTFVNSCRRRLERKFSIHLQSVVYVLWNAVGNKWDRSFLFSIHNPLLVVFLHKFQRRLSWHLELVQRWERERDVRSIPFVRWVLLLIFFFAGRQWNRPSSCHLIKDPSLGSRVFINWGWRVPGMETYIFRLNYFDVRASLDGSSTLASRGMLCGNSSSSSSVFWIHYPTNRLDT